MAPPDDSKLTPVQFEIMQVIWRSPDGVTVAEIWEAVTANREVTRTTVLNLVGRLESRGWLRRAKKAGVYHYQAMIDRATATAGVAERFLDDFFGGSTRDLMLSLLGSDRLSSAEIVQLRKLLSQVTTPSRSDHEEA